ncbi:aldehyde dehydrogenase family protein [Ramlibacter sp. AW1]|uniref:4-(hydroxymethyl)benzenesulfonate dehydrogenase n=1 Tax=Ramlibacter aurantiacus TaxID=2801330 RepID=A0A936ZG28_9BURK|nr:aldehyde dehydrogenase family protein [Ramlibacter aurantiacus]MBL0419237.1 aldehyde dehydrogenase family protein [Ramlibacter aurantiacus]
MSSAPTSEPLSCVAGQWRRGGGDEFAVSDPARAEVVATYRGADASDAAQALDAASQAFAGWSRQVPAERSALLRRTAGLLRERTAQIAALLTLEEGKPLPEARREMAVAADALEWFAEEGRRAYGRSIPSPMAGVQIQTELVPLGVVAAFTPWNFPVMLSAIKAAAALAAGCCVLLKPAEETPLAVCELARAFVDAGLPAGALQLLLGSGAELSAALLPDPRLAKISFTGSTGAGRAVAELAGRHLKPCTLELGGHAPAIVCEDADVQQAVSALAAIKFRNAGQVCANASRFFVHESVLKPFTDAMGEVVAGLRVGPGDAEATQMGPLANARRQAAVAALAEDAVGAGARVARASGRPSGKGWFHPAMLLVDVPDHARVMREEPFGPLLPVTTFRSLDEAIARANALPVGLTAFGFTRSLACARRLGSELRAGSVAINTTQLMWPEAPFGGVAESGWGRENGAEGLLEFVSARTRVVA